MRREVAHEAFGFLVATGRPELGREFASIGEALFELSDEIADTYLQFCSTCSTGDGGIIVREPQQRLASSKSAILTEIATDILLMPVNVTRMAMSIL